MDFHTFSSSFAPLFDKLGYRLPSELFNALQPDKEQKIKFQNVLISLWMWNEVTTTTHTPMFKRMNYLRHF